MTERCVAISWQTNIENSSRIIIIKIIIKNNKCLILQSKDNGVCGQHTQFSENRKFVNIHNLLIATTTNNTISYDNRLSYV